MLLLTENNEAVNTDQIGTEKITYYCVLDFTRPRSPDYYFESVVFIETYQASAAVLEIGPFTVTVPMRWSIMVYNNGSVEVIPLEELSGHLHEAFCLNPISGYLPQYLPIRMVDQQKNVSWTCPSMKKSQMLTVPIGYERNPNGERKKGPLCIMVCEDKAKIPDVVDSSLLW